MATTAEKNFGICQPNRTAATRLEYEIYCYMVLFHPD